MPIPPPDYPPHLDGVSPPAAPKTGAPPGNKNAAKDPSRALTARITANLTPTERSELTRAAKRAQAPSLPWFVRDTLRRAAGLSALPKP